MKSVEKKKGIVGGYISVETMTLSMQSYFICILGKTLGIPMVEYVYSDGYVKSRDVIDNASVNWDLASGLIGNNFEDLQLNYNTFYEFSPEITHLRKALSPMVEPTSRGIQASLFDYFQDTEYFDLQDANELLMEHQNRDINTESIRARIYEGIDKGLFERVGNGLYMVTRQDEQGRENNCLLINGDGRDLSFLPDASVDCILTVICTLSAGSPLGSYLCML